MSERVDAETRAMHQAPVLEAVPSLDESPLARARVHRQLTVEEAARRAEIAPEEVQWLEEGRLYRFPTADRALLATLLYATALGIEHREALDAATPLPRTEWKVPVARALVARALAALG